MHGWSGGLLGVVSWKEGCMNEWMDGWLGRLSGGRVDGWKEDG